MADSFTQPGDFQDIIGTAPPPKPEIREDPRVREIRLLSNSVADALDSGQQDIARALLAEAGTCKWNEITQRMNERHYNSEYSYDGTKETLHLSKLVHTPVGSIKSLYAGGANGTIDQWLSLPRLSITGALCDQNFQ